MNQLQRKPRRQATLAWLGWLLLLGLTTAGTEAHQQKYASTTVALNPNTGNLEVIHRVSAHDAEHVVKVLLDPDANLLSDESTQARFADYVRQHFALKIDGQAAALKFVGFELEGKFFWVYQELPGPISPSQLDIRYDALQEVWPRQINLVNVEGFGPIQSIEFRADQPAWQRVYLEQPEPKS